MEDIGEIADMMQNGSISKSIARKIIEELSKSTSLSPREVHVNLKMIRNTVRKVTV